jgi:hypothetical protein
MSSFPIFSLAILILPFSRHLGLLTLIQHSYLIGGAKRVPRQVVARVEREEPVRLCF